MRIKGKTYCASLRTIGILNRLETQSEGIGLGALAREFGVSKKQIRRDLRVLQRAGRHVELVRAPKGTFAVYVPPVEAVIDGLLAAFEQDIGGLIRRIFGAAKPANGNAPASAESKSAA